MANRVFKSIVIAVACLMFLASSVSACACSHHVVKAEPDLPPCHAAAHKSTAASVDPNADGHHVDTACTCFIRDAMPFVASKSDSKNLKSVPLVKGQNAPESEYAREGCFALQIVFTPGLPSRYDRTLDLSAPSRAPPRL